MDGNFGELSTKHKNESAFKSLSFSYIFSESKKFCWIYFKSLCYCSTLL